MLNRMWCILAEISNGRWIRVRQLHLLSNFILLELKNYWQPTGAFLHDRPYLPVLCRTSHPVWLWRARVQQASGRPSRRFPYFWREGALRQLQWGQDRIRSVHLRNVHDHRSFHDISQKLQPGYCWRNMWSKGNVNVIILCLSQWHRTIVQIFK